MTNRNRRQFLNDVSTGMLLAGAGSIVHDLGVTPIHAADSANVVSLGKYEPLVDLFLGKSLDDLQPAVIQKLEQRECSLTDITAAAALMNARTLGGNNYVGFHCEMALGPALEMSRELPTERQALPVLKVLYRTCANIEKAGARKKHALKPVAPREVAADANTAIDLRDTARAKNTSQAESTFAGLHSATERDARKSFNLMQPMVLDNSSVHRVVLAHRCWQLTSLVGEEHAQTILRQSVRYCVDEERNIDRPGRDLDERRGRYPKAIDQHKLLSRKPKSRRPNDAWVGQFAKLIYESDHIQGIDATAAAIADGIELDSIAEALCLAANELMLRHDKDPWRGRYVHGNSTGLHAADAMNAYRQIARDCDYQHGVLSLLVGANYVSGRGRFRDHAPYPHADHLEAVKDTEADRLLDALSEAIRGSDQARASAIAHRYGELEHSPRAIFDRLLSFAISEDGKLHNEKYYRTASFEFAKGRKSLRWRHVVSLARVMASSYGLSVSDRRGHRAPGYSEACELLNVKT